VPNRVRFDGAARRFYEVWYFIFNDHASGDGFWIRYTLLNPLDDRAEAGAALWFAHTCHADPRKSIAIQRGFGRDLEARPGSFEVRIGNATLGEGHSRGGFEADGHSVAWNLRYQPSPAPHYYFDEPLRRLSARRTSVTLPNPQIFLTGEVTVDGETMLVERASGHQAHHWGVERAPRWLWGHCCAFEDDPPAVLELLAPQVPGGAQLAFVSLYTSGRRYRATGLRSILRNRACGGLGFWHFEGVTREHRVIADVTVDPRYVQRFTYVSPSYRTSECWNTQVGDCLVRVYRGERLELALRAYGTAAAEVHDEEPSRIAYAAWHGGQSKTRNGNAAAPSESTR
jgi:hypothetical protein